MKAAKPGAALDCGAIREAIGQLQSLIEEAADSSPEEVRKGMEAFASALKKSGLVRDEEKDKNARILLSDIVELLPMPNFAPYMGEVEAFELLTSEYNDPDKDDMKRGGELFASFGPKLVEELERIEKECLQAKPKS